MHKNPFLELINKNISNTNTNLDYNKILMNYIHNSFISSYLMNIPAINNMGILNCLPMMPEFTNSNINKEYNSLPTNFDSIVNKNEPKLTKKLSNESFIETADINGNSSNMLNLYLNNISVNECSLEFFPYIDINLKFLSVKLNKEFVNDNKIKIVNMNKNFYISTNFPRYINNEYLFCNYKNSFNSNVNTVQIFKAFYKDFKIIINSLNNSVKYKKKIFTKEYCLLKLEMHIKNINNFIQKLNDYQYNPFNLILNYNETNSTKEIFDYKTNSFSKQQNNSIKINLNIKKEENEKEELVKKPLFKVLKENSNIVTELNSSDKKIYKCSFCSRTFLNGPSLGGHTRQTHPNQSIKYKEKMIIRKKRTFFRNSIKKIKWILFHNHGLNYNDLLKLGKKDVIKKFIKDNIKEYIQLKKKFNYLKNVVFE